MRAVLRELCALAALATFVVGVGSVGLLVTEHNNAASTHTVAMAVR